MENISAILQTAGGLGLFLLGMIVMTDGLRVLAGGAMRTALMRFTSSPYSGAVTGALTTAVLQSSSATTVAAVGFVSAGLLGFSESLGIIFGANIGTTITGWLVVLLGFKFKLGTVILPFVLLGAIMRLFASGRVASFGFAMAGFGLIFIGIATLQQGMLGLQDVITPDSFPADTLAGRVQLVMLGVGITIITQSSSAGVATTLTALFAGAISFEQAAALVIGMDIGTTATAVIASIGGSAAARRTGFSHVIYNLFTATGALLLITPYTLLWEAISPGALVNNAEIALVAFHTSYNTAGVMIALPFTSRFARMMKSLVREKAPAYTGKLDRSLLSEPGVAITAVQSSVYEQLLALLRHVNALLGSRASPQSSMDELQLALDKTQAYTDRIHARVEQDKEWKRLVALIHVLDHMQRLHERCDEEANRAQAAQRSRELSESVQLLTDSVDHIIADIIIYQWQSAASRADIISRQLTEQTEPVREAVMTRVAAGELDVPAATEILKAIRWLDRVSTHMERILFHLAQASFVTGREEVKAKVYEN